MLVKKKKKRKEWYDKIWHILHCITRGPVSRKKMVIVTFKSVASKTMPVILTSGPQTWRDTDQWLQMRTQHKHRDVKFLQTFLVSFFETVYLLLLKY